MSYNILLFCSIQFTHMNVYNVIKIMSITESNFNSFGKIGYIRLKHERESELSEIPFSDTTLIIV